MKLSEVLAISGQPGLYRYVAQSARGVIVESLTTSKRMNVSGSSHVSSLSEISMFTQGEDLPLSEIFTRLFEQTSGAKAIGHKESTSNITAAFEKLLPEYDRDRVHVSDMKKCFAWFNTLVEAGMTTFTEEQEEEQSEAE